MLGRDAFHLGTMGRLTVARVAGHHPVFVQEMDVALPEASCFSGGHPNSEVEVGGISQIPPPFPQGLLVAATSRTTQEMDGKPNQMEASDQGTKDGRNHEPLRSSFKKQEREDGDENR